MKRADVIVAAVFVALALALLAGSAALPAGMSGQPGPGFFPSVIAVVMLALSGALALQARKPAAPAPEAPPAERLGTAGGAVLLTMAYVALWGSGWFAVRTAIYLGLLLRLVGQPWRRSFVVAAVLAGAVTAAFRYGLRVSLE